MNKSESPWVPSKEAIELEFQRKSLKDIHGSIRVFAKKEGIVYGIEEEADTITIHPDAEGNFGVLRAYAEGVVDTLNRALENNNKRFSFELEDRGRGFIIRAIPSNTSS